jgi:hypothetical protein
MDIFIFVLLIEVINPNILTNISRIFGRLLEISRTEEKIDPVPVVGVNR